jgi:hypothetical protein
MLTAPARLDQIAKLYEAVYKTAFQFSDATFFANRPPEMSSIFVVHRWDPLEQRVIARCRGGVREAIEAYKGDLSLREAKKYTKVALMDAIADGNVGLSLEDVYAIRDESIFHRFIAARLLLGDWATCPISAFTVTGLNRKPTAVQHLHAKMRTLLQPHL